MFVSREPHQTGKNCSHQLNVIIYTWLDTNQIRTHQTQKHLKHTSPFSQQKQKRQILFQCPDGDTKSFLIKEGKNPNNVSSRNDGFISVQFEGLGELMWGVGV